MIPYLDRLIYYKYKIDYTDVTIYKTREHRAAEIRNVSLEEFYFHLQLKVKCVLGLNINKQNTVHMFRLVSIFKFIYC